MARRRSGTPTGRRHAGRDERGAVTAEAVMVLPVLALVTLALCWLVGLGVQQARVVDAARETARLVARDVPHGEAVAAGRRVAPPGSTIEVSTSGGEVTVTVSLDVAAPGGIGSVQGTLTSTAVAAREGETG